MENEKHIIQHVINGHTEQYRYLIERYQTGLIIHCENIVKDRQEAEDIAQESFIKAYDLLDSYDESKARFSTWLYRIATNKAIDHLRKHKRTVAIDDPEQYADEHADIELYDDEIAALRKAVDELEPPVYAQVIKAYFWEGKSYQTIAEELDITTNTVGTWMRRAKANLKEVLA